MADTALELAAIVAAGVGSIVAAGGVVVRWIRDAPTIRDISEIKGTVTETNDRVTELNGTVRKHGERIAGLESSRDDSRSALARVEAAVTRTLDAVSRDPHRRTRSGDF